LKQRKESDIAIRKMQFLLAMDGLKGQILAVELEFRRSRVPEKGFIDYPRTCAKLFFFNVLRFSIQYEVIT
jgi:hypothetical protein